MEIGNAKWHVPWPKVPWPIGARARARAREPIDHGITVTDR